MSLTEQQQKVVDAALGNLLISAAAGSGKTRVLVERISDRVIAGRLDVQNVLVMTFTRAAATHMSNRLETALLEAQSRIKEPRERRRLSEQISMLPLAHISTIHSFCNDVIKNYGSDLLDPDGKVVIEPGSSILDSTRAKILLQESIDQVLDSMYAMCHSVLEEEDQAGASPVCDLPQGSREMPKPFSLGNDSVTTRRWCEDFLAMSLCFGSTRSDRPLREMIFSFHYALRSLPDYENRIREMVLLKKREAEDFASSETAMTLIEELKEISNRAIDAVAEAQPLTDSFVFVKDKRKNEEYAGLYADCFLVVRELHALLRKGAGWDDITNLARRLPGGRWPGMSGNLDADDPKRRFFEILFPVFEMVYVFSGGYPLNKDYTSKFKGLIPKAFARSSDEIQEDLRKMYPLLSRLFETVILTDRLYSAKKKAENALDYSDQEQMALRLLKIPEVARYYRELFTEIYIDEYQDNSRIQDAIIEEISSDNVFYVGDIKQSIYRFRHARPDMFAERGERYRGKNGGELLELNGNFRSRPEILMFVNDIFSQLMSRSSGEIEYDASQRLEPMRTENAYDDQPGEVVRVVLIDRTEKDAEESEGERSDTGLSEPAKPKFDPKENDARKDDTSAFSDLNDEEELDMGSIECEGLYVLQSIRELRERHACEYLDFAVLCRTNREAAIIASLLNSNGVPAQGPSETALFTDRELLFMHNLISLIDNVRQDIPLCAVMRADFPDAAFTPEDLLRIFLFAQKSAPEAECFYDKVVLFSKEGSGPLSGKASRFIEFIDGLRTQSMYLKVSELIERIYLSTGMMERVSGEVDGADRVVALETFRDWAGAFERGRRGGLYSFMRYIEEIERGEHRPEDFEVGEQLRNAVRCNSIHKSKGLEYKIVFVCGISGRFSHVDEKRPVILNDSFGIASDRIDPEQGYKYPTLPKLLLAERERRAGLAEYLRLLYVAATRAEERLYLIGSFSRKKDGGIVGHEEFITAPRRLSTEKLPTRLVLRANSFLDLLLLGLSRNPGVSLDELLADEAAQTKEKDILSCRTKDITLQIIDRKEAESVLLESDQETQGPGEGFSDIPGDTEGFAAVFEWSDEDLRLFDIQREGRYPFEELIRMPAKVTVSEMKRRSPPPEEDEDTREGYASGLVPDVSGKRAINLTIRTRERRPMGKQSLLPTEMGILLHSVFQYLDFSALPEEVSREDVREQLDRLVRHNMIRPEQLPYLEPYLKDIADFAVSDICKRMNVAEKTPGCGPFREIPFSITEPVSTEDFRLIQGMIDCWFIEGDSAVLIDYKSDKIRLDRAETERVLKERYAVQLGYYARAIEAASRLKVKEKIIWLIPEATSFAL
ncbi:MAG: UvrD-helicase domain-containing protein [Clostridiales bacterium]|nr:UvrD-helicase domain-containing protein [Clostridiales bacterium]